MKNTVLGMITTIIVGLFIVALTATGFAQGMEEVDKTALIEELIYEGFEKSEENENIWVQDVDLELDTEGEYAMAYARYDTERNIGILTVVGHWTEDGVEYHHQSYAVRWNFETEDFDILGEFTE